MLRTLCALCDLAAMICVGGAGLEFCERQLDREYLLHFAAH